LKTGEKLGSGGQIITKEEEGMKDLTLGQPDDTEVTEFKDFKGICKPCTSSCGGGCAEGWAYRNKKCVADCDKNNEEKITLDSFSVCKCQSGYFRNKMTQNCDACASGCSKCQDAKKCDVCGSNQYLSINPLNKKRECVSKCADGFVAVKWDKMSQGIKDIYTKDKKKSSTKKILAGKTDSKTTDSKKALNATELKKIKERDEKETKLKSRNPLEEVETFKAVTFAGMCTPCLKGCKKCPKGFYIRDNGDCVKRCDKDTEELTFNATTKIARCKKATGPRLVIFWDSKAKDADLMDDEQV